MYVLVVREADGNETEYDLAGEVVLGRDESADIRLGDGAVSRQHARLFVEDGLCYLEDMGSANGTVIEGQPVVGAVVLGAGQEVVIGPFIFWVEDPEGEIAVGPASGVDPQEKGGGTYSGPPPVPDGAPTLEGLGGVAYGQSWTLNTRNSVGRVDGNTLVLPDPSISRQHAEVILRGEEIIVRDLGSSNGTFVNDEPITSHPVFDGDIVRFGDVEVQVSAGEGMAMPLAGGAAGTEGPRIRPGARSARRGGEGGSRKKLLLGGAVAVVGIIVIAAVLKPKPPKPSPPPRVDPSGPQVSVKEETYRLMRQARAQVESKEWATAERLLKQVVDLDPINTKARDQLRQVQLEGKMAQLFRDATAKRDLGDDQMSLELFITIDPRSTYYGQAKYAVASLIPNMLKKYRGDCLGNYRARHYREAVKTCRQHQDLACQCSEFGDKLVSQYLKQAQGIQKVPAADRWRCPVALASWVPCATQVQGDCADAVRRRYPSRKIAEAMALYCDGSALKAMGKLKKITDRYSDSDRDQAVDISSNMKVVEGKWKEGTALILRGDPESAKRVWDVMLTADGKILPGDVTSWYRREARKELQKAFHDKGQEQMNQERYVEAFGWAMKGMAVGKGSPSIKLLLQRLEQQATVEVRRAVTCSEFQHILAMTRSNPPSPTHQQALREAKRRGCQ